VHFAYPLPWWLAVVLAAGVAAAAFIQYRRPLAPISRAQRSLLIALRVVSLAALILFLFRPMIALPPSSAQDAVVPVIVDVSRSMRIVDADPPAGAAAAGRSRIAQAAALLKSDLLPSISARFATELFTVGDGVTPLEQQGIDRLDANGRKSALSSALQSIRERYRGRRVPGIILLSDGGDTGGSGHTGPEKESADGPPVYTIGVGSPDELRDREVLGVTAGDPRIDRAAVDLRVSAVTHGYGRAPFTIRVLANGRLLETRKVTPRADGSPVDEAFTVSPDPVNPTVFTAEIPADAAESVTENNTRGVLVSPAGRRRRILIVEGAPGFEHSFMTRAWAGDPGLEVDVVTRKGRNADNVDTYFVQAGAGRAAALTTGFAARRDQLFAYDALVLANVEADALTRAQLSMAGDFVSERGGGLLVMGGRSFAQRGLSGTPLEEVLPVELGDRRGAVVQTANADDVRAYNKVALTADGASHPIMRLGASPDETRKRWAALPALAASAALGGPRPGASVLAMTTAPGGGVFPVIAVQRYGQGRSMIFAGEASWRWKMMVPSSDKSYEVFWRQAARWLSADSPDPVAITLPETVEPGDMASATIDVRDASFAAVPDAVVDGTLTAPGGEATPLKLRHADSGGGRFVAALATDRQGLYRVRVEAHKGATALGSADRWLYVGGADREFADPRLNEAFLRRLARSTGGRYARASDASQVASWLQSSVPADSTPERRDLWHEPWAFAAIVLLLSAEWTLRRWWGLR
jgi:uncharacterized membrane protein